MTFRRDDEQWTTAFINLKPSGQLMFFGRPSLMWDGAPSPEDYFKSFGFDVVHSLDVSAYQGADYVHDLNSPAIAEELRGRYDVVHSGGTLEHVFNILNAVKAACDLLKVGGTFICGTPVNNHIDHGFWQVSPTAKFDYFADNQFEFGTSAGNINLTARAFRRVVPLYPGEAKALNFVPGRIGHMLQVVKTDRSTLDRIPMQSAYLKRLTGRSRKWRFKPFEPFDVGRDAVRVAPSFRFTLDPAAIKPHRDGFFYYRFLDDRFPPSVQQRPFRSKALVFENGDILDWIVSSEDMLCERPGSFCHVGGRLNFTARDGGDPRRNGARYEVAFSQPYEGVNPYRADATYPMQGSAGPRT